MCCWELLLDSWIWLLIRRSQVRILPGAPFINRIYPLISASFPWTPIISPIPKVFLWAPWHSHGTPREKLHACSSTKSYAKWENPLPGIGPSHGSQDKDCHIHKENRCCNLGSGNRDQNQTEPILSWQTCRIRKKDARWSLGQIPARGTS